jgi:hypothetical protein
MSAYLYGRMRRSKPVVIETLDAAGTVVETTQGRDNKIVEGLAAVIPADVIALHALVLAATTETVAATKSAEGAVRIVSRTALQWSLPVLALLAIGLFVLGHLKASESPSWRWDKLDFVRMFLPASAFLAWAALTGTSAATPWLEHLDKGWAPLIGGTLGVVVLALATSLADK